MAKTRKEILDDMLRGWNPPADGELREAILTVMESFSIRQLSRMERAGVRFWTVGPLSLPDTIKIVIDIPAGKTSYMPQARVIHLASKISVPEIRHEMAHAWDHIRTLKEKDLRRIDNLNDKQIEAVLGARIRMNSQAERIEKMFESYRNVLKKLPRELSFDLGAREGYSATSPQEFYAEGYSVFHSNQISNQARLFLYARKLYDLLEKEANDQGLTTPPRADIEREIKQQKYPSP